MRTATLLPPVSERNIFSRVFLSVSMFGRIGVVHVQGPDSAPSTRLRPPLVPLFRVPTPSVQDPLASQTHSNYGLVESGRLAFDYNPVLYSTITDLWF